VWVRIELQRLIFDFVRKKVPVVAGAFFTLLWAFLRVVFGKRVFFVWCFCGELLVESW
jgi:hypothetical protein